MLTRVFLALSCLLFCSSTALARSAPSEGTQARALPQPPVRARGAVVMDAVNGKVLYAVNAHTHLPMASTTKIMTALLALQLGNLSDRIKVPKGAFNYEWDATVMGLRPGQVVTLRDLLYGLLLPSGADAANTIAIHYGGSESGFVAMMNREAVALGMHDTHYVNAHGLTARNHYTSAYDLAVLAQYVSYNPDLMKIAGTKYYTWNGHVLTNANHVLFWYPGVDGIKPGFTDDAGICQVLDAQRNGRHIVVTLLNTPNLDTDARNLLNYGLQDYSWVQSLLPGDNPGFTESGTDRWGPYVYFPASGHYLRGGFLTAYRANGGYPVLGLPRTEELTEGKSKVQYFQNGALSATGNGSVKRRSLGALSFPTVKPSPTPTGTPTPRPTPSPTPREGTVVPGGIHAKAKNPLLPRANPTATPRTWKSPMPAPRPTRTSAPQPIRTVAPQPTRTSVPQPIRTSVPPPPTVTPTPTRTSTGGLTATVFKAFQGTHRVIGTAVSASSQIKGYTLQVFSYGALLYDPLKHGVYLLPVGDRYLSAKRYLPSHPGNAYPPGFAPLSTLKAIGWLPHTTLAQLHSK